MRTEKLRGIIDGPALLGDLDRYTAGSASRWRVGPAAASRSNAKADTIGPVQPPPEPDSASDALPPQPDSPASP